MKESYLETRKKELDSIEHAYRYANVLRHAVKQIQVPEGCMEPDLHMYVSPGRLYIWLHSWPMEASCGFVAELEELLLTSAIPTIDSGSHTIDHTFLKGSEFEFKVYVSPLNCKWEGDPGKFEWVQSNERPKC